MTVLKKTTAELQHIDLKQNIFHASVCVNTQNLNNFRSLSFGWILSLIFFFFFGGGRGLNDRIILAFTVKKGFF